MAVCRGSLFSLFSHHLRPTVTTHLLPATTTTTRHYAKPMGGFGKKGKLKLGPTVEKVRLSVETDTEKLVSQVCGSHPVKEGREDIKLKDDVEYPDWLWELRTDKPPPLRDLDPSTKQYWKRLRVLAMKENNKRMKLRKF
ncbi:39S ribosomal protein L54, mitochondrial-like [Portunus trituberculatus]|uniref:39S ribosomal protein L54, mitochondrial-like n=1 Tax=Portunus trituberculatus TaxID=210409 RepID=UPI001E1CDEA6|nr:39S ribosomal protein L54, mitochondrial-like [Portunus trituberculatus]